LSKTKHPPRLAGDTELIAARIAQRLRDAGFVFEVLEPPAVE
jgi:flavodoxin